MRMLLVGLMLSMTSCDNKINLPQAPLFNMENIDREMRGRGCCSHHGGEAYCDVFNHHWVCSDGQISGCSCY